MIIYNLQNFSGSFNKNKNDPNNKRKIKLRKRNYLSEFEKLLFLPENADLSDKLPKENRKK